jgi:transketolase
MTTMPSSQFEIVFDMTMQQGGGHGGSAVGMAAIGVALWKYTMRYNPNNPSWFDRDRFVLSNGETEEWCSLFILLSKKANHD